MTFKGQSRSSEMSRLDRTLMISSYHTIDRLYLSLARYLSKIAKFMYLTCI